MIVKDDAEEHENPDIHDVHPLDAEGLLGKFRICVPVDEDDWDEQAPSLAEKQIFPHTREHVEKIAQVRHLTHSHNGHISHHHRAHELGHGFFVVVKHHVQHEEEHVVDGN